MTLIVEERRALIVSAEEMRAAYAAIAVADRTEARVAKAHMQAAKDHERTRADAQRVRLDCGRMLIASRKQWPARGPRAKGWGDFLREAGIEQSVAFRLMQLAGFVGEEGETEAEISCPPSNGHEIIPSRREIDQARREEMAEPSPRPPANGWQSQLVGRLESMTRHIKAAFSDAEYVEQMCAEHEATPMSPAIITARSMAVALKGTATQLVKKLGGPNG